ncbi:HD-GYP domain-containing protein [Streptosporangium sp. NPDC023615]|uniref:HD-GYP domain-containing protein n=1 Tax=Streptosporangium sp. NPDC023615 TaxID=3154794 RepID=UPI00342CD4C9
MVAKSWSSLPGGPADEPDPTAVQTVDDLAAGLKLLAGTRSYADLNKAADGKLPKSTVSDVFAKGRPSVETLELFLRACMVPRVRWPAWQAARERALAAAVTRSAELIRVERADPRRLGVHAAIDAPGAFDDLPVYVSRDTDTAPRGVRALLAKSSDQGGMVVLVGGSSVGKSRCAYEAIRAVMPQWWLLHPADAEQVRQVAEQAPARLVVWLDELQRYLGGPLGLTAATVRTLLRAGAVLIATVWPERYTTYTALSVSSQPDLYAVERELLDLADIVHLPASFSAGEYERARAAAAAGDQRITLALRSADYGLTQTIAAAPQLVDRWCGADPYAAAVLNAAIDATRLGVVSPLSANLLRVAAPGYCDARQRGAAAADWFETALAYAAGTLNGAAAALAPVADPGAMGQAAGYLVADYLQQHAGRQRRLAEVPATCWQALVENLTDPGDQVRVAGAAQNRLLHHHAELLYRQAMHSGEGHAAALLAGLLVGQGRVGEALAIWRARADAGDEFAAVRLASLLDEQGRVGEALAIWRARADAGDGSAAVRSTGLLVGQGRVEEALAIWRARADAGDGSAAVRSTGPRTAGDATDALAEALMAAMEVKDFYTRRHSERISQLVLMIGRQLGMRHGEIEAARLAGLLHDIGKLAIPDIVLRKSGALTDEEFTLIQSHVTYGVSIVRQALELFDGTHESTARDLLVGETLRGILHHHERFDGHGYPMGLVGHEIPKIARVVAVADVFDAMMSARDYRPAYTLEKAVAEIRRAAGSQLDPRMGEAFMAVLDEHPDQIAELMHSCSSCDPHSR